MSDTQTVLLRWPFDYEGKRYDQVNVRMPTLRDRSVLGLGLVASRAMIGDPSDFALHLVAQFSGLSMAEIDELAIPDCAAIYHVIAARFRELGAEIDANA